MSIQMVKIRAKIAIGSRLNVKTPFIVSFSVNKTRGQISTFSARIKVSSAQIAGTISGESIKIWAGRDSANNLIFSGIVKKATISPNVEDPNYVVLNLEGADILSKLEGKKYTRRSTASEASWISIDGVQRPGLRSGKFKARYERLETVAADPVEEQPVKTARIALSDTIRRPLPPTGPPLEVIVVVPET